MTLDIKEHEGGMTAIFIGRLDTPSAVKAQQEIVPLLDKFCIWLHIYYYFLNKKF